MDILPDNDLRLAKNTLEIMKENCPYYPNAKIGILNPSKFRKEKPCFPPLKKGDQGGFKYFSNTINHRKIEKDLFKSMELEK